MNEELRERIEGMINKHKVFLFMKGTPDMPECGFSMKVSQILKQWDLDLGYFDVLTDDTIRQGIKEFANWPTIPQLYIDSKFIGGCDITVQMFESGELQKLLGVDTQ